MTECLARKAANGNVMCGRQDDDGQYACTGPIGAVDRGVFYFLPGIEQDDLSRPGWWKPTAHAARLIAKGQMPSWRRTVLASDGTPVLIWKQPELPARYPCPYCKCVAIVTAEVVSSH